MSSTHFINFLISFVISWLLFGLVWWAVSSTHFINFLISFVISWLLFGLVWWAVAWAHGDLSATPPSPSFQPCVVNVNSFTSAFLFSIETQHTIGYGSRASTDECPEVVASWLVVVVAVVVVVSLVVVAVVVVAIVAVVAIVVVAVVIVM